MRVPVKAALAGCALWLGCNNAPPAVVGTQESAVAVDYGHGRHDAKTSHVLLLSIDGFHDFDLANYVASHPNSALASLVARGTLYTQAYSTAPSDSFPATLAMTTGGSPSSTGVYYDAMWDDNLSAPGSDCSTRGTAVSWKENINFTTVALPATAADINPASLPRDPDNGCAPVYPHQFLKVNTIYEVIHNAGMRTAAMEKHPSYEILSGPSGTGLDDFYGPEFNPGKKDIDKTRKNDALRLAALLNQLDGYDHTGTVQVGVPAILGMNFQEVNIAQKFSGYTDAAGTTPDNKYFISGSNKVPLGLAQAMDTVDAAIQSMLNRLEDNGLTSSTVVIMASKHGNSPVDRSTFVPINPDTTFPALVNSVSPGLLGTVTADTAALIWLKDHSRAAEVADVLRNNAAAIGGGTVYVGAEIDALVDGQMAGNPGRHPDILVQPADGVVYTTAGSKICDHGGLRDQDRHVAMVIAGGKFHPGTTVTQPVTLQQVAPTILKALNLNRHELDAVNIENTHRLPDGDADDDGCDADD